MEKLQQVFNEIFVLIDSHKSSKMSYDAGQWNNLLNKLKNKIKPFREQMVNPDNFDAIEAVVRTVKYSGHLPTAVFIHEETVLPEGTTEKEFPTPDAAIEFAKDNGIQNVVLRVVSGRVILCYRK